MKKKIVAFILIILLVCGVIFCGIFFINKDKNEIDNETTTTKNHENKKEDKNTVKLTLVGDLLFESPFYKAVDSGYDKNEYFKNVKKYFLDDDISIGNMEVVIGNNTLTVSGDGYNFCAPSYIGDLVNTLDFEILSTANNHANDRGNAGLISTLDYFKNNTNIKTVGTYYNEQDRKNLRVIEKNGIKFGFLSYTYGTNITSTTPNNIGLFKNPTNKTFTKEYEELLTKEINELKSVSDVQIVMMHWGNEFTFTPTNEQKNLALFLNKLGVDIIYGSHSHSIQPIEIIGDEEKTLVYYSLGNFVSHDDDIARTPKGQETFDNAYQFGLLSKIELEYTNGKVKFNNINTIPIVNYFDSSMNNFLLIPFDSYDKHYETTHLRYKYGLTREFISNTFNNVIDDDFR